MKVALHLHDTRGPSPTRMPRGARDAVRSTVGAGGCPFAASCWRPATFTEELVLLCEEMGIDTGVDLDALIEVGRMAESIVGHTLPGELVHAGSLDAFRRKAAA